MRSARPKPPTVEEIREQTALIRSKWSEAEHRRRWAYQLEERVEIRRVRIFEGEDDQ